MVKIRSKFYKKEDMVFISHLDLIRVFERAMRRAQIPIAYTQGFNPHPIMAFATALGLGVSSDAEYIDITLYENVEDHNFEQRLNKELPEGIKILKSKEVPLKENSLMATVKSSAYLVRFLLLENIEKNIVEDNLKEFEKLDTIIIKKEKRKKQGNRWITKIQEINIRQSILDIKLEKFEEKELILKMILTAGEFGNIKPEIVVDELSKFGEILFLKESLRIHRLELLNEAGDELM